MLAHHERRVVVVFDSRQYTCNWYKGDHTPVGQRGLTQAEQPSDTSPGGRIVDSPDRGKRAGGMFGAWHLLGTSGTVQCRAESMGGFDQPLHEGQVPFA